jgi:four helix bundle protein
LKELRESLYWLKVIKKSDLLPPEKLDDISKEASELSNIIDQSILTAKRNKKQ